jgi:hypothetical protein
MSNEQLTWLNFHQQEVPGFSWRTCTFRPFSTGADHYEKFAPDRHVPTIQVFRSLPDPAEIGCPVTVADIDGQHTFEGRIRALDYCLAVV